MYVGTFARAINISPVMFQGGIGSPSGMGVKYSQTCVNASSNWLNVLLF